LSFPPTTAKVEHWHAFMDLMICVLAHVERHLYGLKEAVAMSPDLAWGRCVALLTEVYGKGGAKVAFELARTGQETGVQELLRKCAYHIADQVANNHIRLSVGAFWSGLTLQGKCDAIDEFLSKHAHLLPSELTEGGAWRIRADFPSVLEHFVELLQRIRQI
jgi:hypothetical protein